MAYFRCTTGGSGKGNTLVVTCADDLAGATITCTNGTKTYTKTCPSTAPYEVTFYGLAAGTWTVSATVSGNTYTTTVVITDYEAELGGFNWKTWVDLSENYTSSDFTDLDDLLSDETAIRELMTIHACVDYLAGIAAASADVEQIIENDYCAKWINNRDYALDTLYANEIIADYMDTADKYFYGEWVITDDTTTPPTWGAKGNVPIMTANNAPYGEASATSQYSSDFAAWKAFNGIIQVGSTNYWSSANNQVTNQRIVYKFANPICVKRFSICNAGNATRSANHVKLQYSNDGTTWNDADSTIFENPSTAFQTTAFTAASTQFALYWGVLIIDNHGATNEINVTELQFYGRELSVSVPTMTGYTTPYGTVTSDSENTNYNKAWEAFGGDTSKIWLSQYSATNAYVQYEFTSNVVAKKMSFYNSKDTYGGVDYGLPTSLTLYGVDSGGNLTELLSESNLATNVLHELDIDNNVAFTTYRLKINSQNNSNSGGTCRASCVNFYGLDYSEKEFEEGTNKKWLYDHGVELVEISQFATTNGLAEKLFDELYTRVSGGQNLYGTFYVDNFACDIYELMFVKNGSIGYSSSGNGDKIGSMGVADDIQAVGYSSYALANKDLFIPLTTKISSLDITQISGNHKIFVGSGGYQSITREMSISELWLE